MQRLQPAGGKFPHAPAEPAGVLENPKTSFPPFFQAVEHIKEQDQIRGENVEKCSLGDQRIRWCCQNNKKKKEITI